MKNVLFLLHLPPPIHGASVVGQTILESKLVNNTFKSTYINMSASSHVEDVGRLKLKKIVFLVSNWLQCMATIIRLKPNLCYITPSSDGWGFYRDFILVQSIKLFNIKIVLHFHNKGSEKWNSKKVNRLLLKIFFKRVKIILLGKELYPEKAPYISEKNVFYCPNGVQSVAKTPSEIIDKKGTTHFLFLSNMIKSKGVFVLLDACKILKEKRFEFRCDFVGGWKDISEKEFEQKVVEYDLQRAVKYHGPKYRNEKKCFFEQADVFVFPTYYHGECFPLVLLEAMDYALPCLSTKNGAIPSLIEKGKTGFCILQKNVGVLSEKMIWMIEHPNERREMGQSGKKRFEENFTIEKFEHRMVSILDYCINS